MLLEQCAMILKGIPICGGIAIGKPRFLRSRQFAISETPITQGQMKREIERYRRALICSKEAIEKLQVKLKAEAVLEGVTILEAQLEMLQDPLLTVEIEKGIKKLKRNAEFVFQKALVKYQARFESFEDPFFVDKFQDLQDVAFRVFGYLNKTDNDEFNELSPHSIICASDLIASDAASAQNGSISAFITEVGGPTSHAAIMAKSLGIPYVTNICLKDFKNSCAEIVIVDGRTGRVIINPSEEVVKNYEQLKNRIRDQFRILEKVTKEPSVTQDGQFVRLYGNMATPEDLDLIKKLEGEGIGLFRSEYILLSKQEIPSEEEQYQIYRKIACEVNPSPVTIRTFDLSGDKAIKFPCFTGVERTSFFSGRTTRVFLREKNILRTQLKAILRANEQGNISVLFPMISTIDELREAKNILKEAQNEVGISHVRVGCMIEVPSAALVIDHIVRECDFLSIGTNDLIQYALAQDRNALMLHDCLEPIEPSIIRLIKSVANEANRAKIPVAVCGEMASDPRFIALLLGLGIREFSVTPRFLPVIKNAIRRTDIQSAEQLVNLVLDKTTSQEILELIMHNYRKDVPEIATNYGGI